MLWTQNLTHYLLPCLTMASYSKLHPWLGQSQSARPKRVSTNTLQQQHLPQEERIVKVIITIMLGKYLFVYQYRVQSSLVHAKWWRFQLLRKWQELKPKWSSQGFRDRVFGFRQRRQTWVRKHPHTVRRKCTFTAKMQRHLVMLSEMNRMSPPSLS